MKIVFIDLENLHPIEGYIETLLPKVMSYTINNKYWLEVIKIEKHNLILDGHHRFEIAKRLGLKRIPCIIFDYNDIKMWSLRPNVLINSKEEIIDNALRGTLYPSKTVKHKFPDLDYSCKIKLEELI
jgi:L-serine kinase (ADP)